jgi:hypothetical protein
MLKKSSAEIAAPQPLHRFLDDPVDHQLAEVLGERGEVGAETGHADDQVGMRFCSSEVTRC